MRLGIGALCAIFECSRMASRRFSERGCYPAAMRVVLASPRGFCAGVDRAIEVRFEEAESAAKTLSSKDGKTLERLLRQMLAELSSSP